ncbi:MAG: hypothetical protein IPJ65_20425 [Archangiaceae bacterium]|nr:hypothetical protein [Archangiaceae bacterium]
MIRSALILMVCLFAACGLPFPGDGGTAGGGTGGGSSGTGGGSGGGMQACPFDAGPNPSQCPAAWSEARSRCFGSATASCSDQNLRCWYPGVGDETNGCFAPGLLSCFDQADGGLEWRCAQ